MLFFSRPCKNLQLLESPPGQDGAFLTVVPVHGCGVVAVFPVDNDKNIKWAVEAFINMRIISHCKFYSESVVTAVGLAPRAINKHV